MSEKKTASLVFTTINDPVILEDYYENFRKYGHLDQIKAFIIPDKKTPAKIFDRCKDMTSRGFKVNCPNIQEQEEYLKKVGFPTNLVPFNSDNRRNVGYLMALESGTDFVISIDDDNWCLDDKDFYAGHAIVCEDSIAGKEINSSNGWFNVCNMMEMSSPKETYPRGFPYYARHQKTTNNYKDINTSVDINAGLWLIDPDVDGISWMVNPSHSKSFKGESLIMGDDAWGPVNTQNTALKREVIAAYYFVKMGYQLRGAPIDRYGDIFSGYFAQACTRNLGAAVRFGTPIADHKRNSHNYMNDAANEWSCIMLLEDILPWLKDLKLEGDTYPDTYISLANQLEDFVEKQTGKIWSDLTCGYFHQMAYCMRAWAAVCRKLI